MSNHDEFGAFLVGFVVGGLTGAVAALLMAPQSGEETRAVIKEKAIVLRDKTGETVDEAYARAEAAAAEARARFEELAETTKTRASELSQKGSVVLEEQKAKITSRIGAAKKAASDTAEEAAA
ncbi:YtxH domain-containing protein [Levilinea saccharolytica]|nr:YtxH domain-containing protein [Levilinea saccharolytica]GAP17529.1 gas vesicle protein [Levilinea saccharolytica]